MGFLRAFSKLQAGGREAAFLLPGRDERPGPGADVPDARSRSKACQIVPPRRRAARRKATSNASGSAAGLRPQSECPGASPAIPCAEKSQRYRHSVAMLMRCRRATRERGPGSSRMASRRRATRLAFSDTSRSRRNRGRALRFAGLPDSNATARASAASTHSAARSTDTPDSIGAASTSTRAFARSRAARSRERISFVGKGALFRGRGGWRQEGLQNLTATSRPSVESKRRAMDSAPPQICFAWSASSRRRRTAAGNLVIRSSFCAALSR